MHRRVTFAIFVALAMPSLAVAAGTPAGTSISAQVAVAWEIAGEPHTGVSNVVTIAVAEVIDLNVLVQTPQRLVSAGVSDQPLYFTVTNTGNGTESFDLSVISAITGDDFDPVVGAIAIVFDTDGDGDIGSADTHYVPGSNDPVLAPEESLGVFVLADIPAGLGDGLIGFAGLRAASRSATGSPGAVFTALGDAGVDVVLGPGGGIAAAQGEYLVGEISLSLTKMAAVISPQGEPRAVPGATLNYTIHVAAQGTGSAANALFRDAIPAHTQFVPGSLRLDGKALSDAADADSGEFVELPAQVVVRLGELQANDPARVVEFAVSID